MEPSDRKIVTRSPQRTVRLINLPNLLPAPVEAESSLEADFVQRAALVPDTSTLIAQPFRLPVSPKGYTPDYLQTFSGCELKAVVEIKIARQLARYKSLFDDAAGFLREKGYTFYVVTEKELRRENINQRVTRVLRYAKAHHSQEVCARIEHVMAEYPKGLPIGSLCRKADVSRELILHLIANRRLVTGYRLLIDDAAVITLPCNPTASGRNPFEHALGISPWESTDQH